MSRFLALLCLVASAASGQDATGVIVGTVTEAETGEALPFVTVLLVGTTRGASTGVDGAYRIEAVPRGPVTLRFQFVGYEPVEVKATLRGDSLRIDAELRLMWGGPCDEIVAEYYSPLGVFDDLPRGWRGDHRPRRPEWLADVADRASRSLSLDRGADRHGRWQPVLPGLGAPAVYVDGVRSLSLDGLPPDVFHRGQVHARYVPAAYGASAAGAIVASTSTRSGRTGWGGVSGTAPAGLLRVNAPVVLERDHCGDPSRQIGLHGEADRTTVRSESARGARARVAYLDDVLHLRTSVDAAVRRRAGTESQVMGRVALGGPLDDGRPLVTASGGVVEGEGRTVTLMAFRAAVQSWGAPAYAVGIEGARNSVATLDAETATSSLAAYAQRGLAVEDWGPLDPYLQIGIRIERIGTEGTAGERSVLTLQPRAQATVDLSRTYHLVYAYGTGAAGTTADGTGRVIRRTEAGLGFRYNGQQIAPTVGGGLVGYARRVDGVGVGGTVVGGDLDLEVPGPLGGRLWVRGRIEGGDTRFARDRWVIGADWLRYRGTLPDHLRIFSGTGAYFDMSEGALEADGRRPQVARLGVRLGVAHRGSYRRPLRFHFDTVLRGRDAVPCVDPFGGPEAAHVSCPVPDARVLVAVPL